MPNRCHVYIATMLLMGCGTPPPPAPPVTVEPSAAPTRTPTPSTSAPPVTMAPTATDTAIATAELPPAEAIEPLVEDTFVLFVGWSPQEDWVAYWKGDIPLDRPEPSDLILHFHNVETGRVCPHPELPYNMSSLSLTLQWLADDSAAIVISGDAATQVTPCGESVPTALPVLPYESEGSWVLSPDQTYIADTVGRGPARELNYDPVETTLIELSTGTVAARAEWTTPGGIGGVGAGGNWINNSWFLVRSTRDRGPLLLGTDGSVIEIAPDLFREPAIPETPPGEEYLWAAAGAADSDGDYHLVMYGVGTALSFPHVPLYHSETGEVETLDFQQVWQPVFSPDGEWLLLNEPRFDTGYEVRHLWLRQLDPVGSTPRFIAASANDTKFDPSGARLAMALSGGAEDRGVRLYSFPDGEPLRVWNTGQYGASYLYWSPGSVRLAVIGGKLEQMALFVVEP